MTTDTLLQPAIQDNTHRTHVEQAGQYTLWQILGIWALGALPSALMAWVFAPMIIPNSPLQPGITYWLLMIGVMAWQFVVSLVIIYRELGTVRWSAIRQRIWLQTPRDPGTDQPNPRLFWWVLPAILFAGLVGFVFAGYLEAPIAWLFPAVKPALYMDISQLASPQMQGQWWLLGIALVSFIFNYFLGEEFLYRGILLPKMQGVFGKYDWVANSVLFGLYHLHKPWSILSNIVMDLGATFPARRFRSTWITIIVHGAEGLITLTMILGVLLGLATR
jgi:uncharacterized protein